MYHGLSSQKKRVGLKESRRAIKEGQAQFCYVAKDADKDIIYGMGQLCTAAGVPTDMTHTMEELGNACGIDVKAAVVTILKEDK
jgi:large subunit ribosomal protein L7A